MPSSNKKVSHKAGRNKVKCERYLHERRREKNKLPRVLQSNGARFARVWAKANGMVTELERML